MERTTLQFYYSILTTFLLLIPNVDSIWEILHSGINDNISETPCFPRDSCFPFRKEEEDHLWGDFTCECAMHCIQHGTCCVDSPYAATLFYMKSQTHTCHKLERMTDTVLAISTCSDRWRNVHQIVSKCEDSELDMSDPISLIPVTNLVTRNTYKNYFCALCNDDAEDSHFWNVLLGLGKKGDNLTVTCEYIQENIFYDESQHSWGIKIKDSFYGASIQVGLPNFLKKMVKKCYLNTIAACDSSYNHFTDLQYKCSAYYAPIKQKTGPRVTKFRNIHCAMCNGVSFTKDGADICKLEDTSRRPKRPFSFALLMDINRSDGDLVGRTEIRCEDGEIWDPFFKKCRTLTCALPGHVIVNQKCVPS